jgi:hypothetical protein
MATFTSVLADMINDVVTKSDGYIIDVVWTLIPIIVRWYVHSKYVLFW